MALGSLRHTHTYALLDVSPSAFDEIWNKLNDAGYGDQLIIHNGTREIDLHGIGLSTLNDPEILAAGRAVTIDTVAANLVRPSRENPTPAEYQTGAARHAALGRSVAADIARKVLAGGPDVFACRAALEAIRDGTEPVWPSDRKDLRD